MTANSGAKTKWHSLMKEYTLIRSSSGNPEFTTPNGDKLEFLCGSYGWAIGSGRIWFPSSRSPCGTCSDGSKYYDNNRKVRDDRTLRVTCKG